MKLFRILFVFDALAFVVLFYFFADGLRYEPGPDYIGTWLPVLLVPAGVLAGAWILRGKGKLTLANVLLGILATPFLLYALFVGLFIVLDPDMR
jgi:hypothetical protein